ncbi:MAG: VCBS repeat-containing protein, partial [Saprospiraceae bacterium]|nr:VCBS repeat-containing protein [Saprospiraceae bacterium]
MSFRFALIAQVPFFLEKSSECGITDVASFTDLYGNGAAAADFDNDGDIDFYLTTDENIPDRLYVNDGKGNFTDKAIEFGILETNSNRTALWFDYNGDHLLDLLVAGENCVNLSCESPVYLALYKQLEDGNFTEVTEASNLVLGPEFDFIDVYAIGGLAAADLNQDDFLDLVITVWGGGIKLFQNNGDETFTDVTIQSRFRMESKTPWQPMLYDFNQDGLIDIYCNVDFAPNKLWINRGTHFEERAFEYGLHTAFNEMGMAMT